MNDDGFSSIVQKTVDFFENKVGKTKLLEDSEKRLWYKDFVDFIGKEHSELLFEIVWSGGCLSFFERIYSLRNSSNWLFRG